MMNNVALLIFACDRYELLYKGFDFFFKKNWDHSKHIKAYFATENKDIHLSGYVHLTSGYGAWTNRLKSVLNQVKEDYIIFFQEDMWLHKKVQTGTIEKIVNYVIENDLKLVKLHSSEVYTTNELGIDFDGLVLSKVMKEKSAFLMSHQVSIWNKDFFLSQLKDNEHPWRNERKGTKRLKKNKEDIYQIDFLSENEKPPINKNHVEGIQGGYHTVSMNACIQMNAKRYIKELEPIYPQYAKKLMYHLDNQITHDGGKIPRKKDLFKKVKDTLRGLFKD